MSAFEKRIREGETIVCSDISPLISVIIPVYKVENIGRKFQEQIEHVVE